MALGSEHVEETDASMRLRLVDSLSNSFPGSALTRALHTMDDDSSQGGGEDPLSNSCFAELRLEKGAGGDEDDDELTSLAWLQSGDLLKNLRAGDKSLCTSPIDEDDAQKENGDLQDGGYSRSHPPNVPYNPLKHVNSKPPYSFSCLIFMAIEDSPQKKLPVKDIYNWILTHFPYFQNAPTGWKNSVRHNLSLNKCFKKVDKEKGQSIGKGSLWCIDPDYRPNLLQALRKTPYHPYHQLQMLANPQPPTTNYHYLPGVHKPLPLAPRYNINMPSPHLFPFLSRRLAQSKFETASDIDVANTLVSLKSYSSHRSRQRDSGWSGDEGHDSSRSPSPPEFGSERERQLLKKKHRHAAVRPRPSSPIVVTCSPSDDHTYSLTSIPRQPTSPSSSIDEEYEFEDDSEMEISDMEEEMELREQHRIARERYRRELAASRRPQHTFSSPMDEEEMKIVEGADALLNLAGIKTASIVPMRSISPMITNASSIASSPSVKSNAGSSLVQNNNSVNSLVKVEKEPVEPSNEDKDSEGNEKLVTVKEEKDTEEAMEMDDSQK